MRSGVLTSISSRQRSAISGHPLAERTDLGFGPRNLQLYRPTYAPTSRSLHPKMFSGYDSADSLS